MDISIIIVSWNVRDLLRQCLASVETYHGALEIEVIVVDSASSDDTPAMIEKEFPTVRLFAQSENIGFVGGNNLGLAHATGRYVMLLNPDTRVHPHALAILVETLAAHPEIGILGPQTLNTDGTHQSTRRRFPSWWLSLLDNTNFAPLNSFYLREMPDDGDFAVDWVQGSALLARREVYDQISGLDPAYYMFFEELDWCRRAKDSGWKIWYVGRAIITHHGGASTGQVITRKHVHYQHSKLRYFRKFHGPIAAWSLRLGLVVNYGLHTLIEGGKLMLGHKPELRRERIRSYGVVLRSLLWEGEAKPL